MIWTGLLVGALFGAILQRGRICFNSAFRDILLLKDNYLLKLTAFVFALQMLLFVLLSQLGWMHMNALPLNFAADIIGGYIFGMGMVLAGGCASGVTFRVGEGWTTSWFAVVFFGGTALATRAGAFKGWMQWIGQFQVQPPFSDPTYFVKGSGPTISSVLGINPWIPAVVVAVALVLYAFLTKTTDRPTKFNWKIAAVALAVVAALGFCLSELSGRNYGLGITYGWANLFQGFFVNTPLDWGGTLIIGIVVGSAIAALISGEFKLRMPKHPMTYAQVALGGIFMGFGATTAGGCNIGHFLTGVPQFAISSIVASVFFVLGNWSMSWFLFMRE
jgi:uncharacterized membrane protein YedE/YeeE